MAMGDKKSDESEIDNRNGGIDNRIQDRGRKRRTKNREQRGKKGIFAMAAGMAGN